MEIDVDYVARLARIEIAPEKLEQLRRDMAAIVGYIDELKECDVTGIEPTAHAAKLCNVWREDEPGEPYTREEMLANAPAVVQGELIKVPQVLPGEGMN
ncbi:MAG: Asp-tRNA(Asn)/Glu-tRNA(Gln) amidotransferase subunit GatC [Lentisphaeria bacterium]|nr:Asp-tRNA(Asn)/Glu-tRNA(Gln) amidotransferase subunit GatC [Lentisphaeria bacterium]